MVLLCSVMCRLMDGSFTVGRFGLSFFILGTFMRWSIVLWSFMVFVMIHVCMHWNLSMLLFGVEDGCRMVCLPVVLDDRDVPSIV